MNEPIESVLRAYQADSLECAEGERAVIARVNTGSVDRYRTVIDPKGIDLTAYRKNPVLCWEHGRDPQRGAVPVGRCQWIKYDKAQNGLIAKAIFATDPFSDMLFRMYQDGTLRAFSVNILPQEASAPTKQERAKDPSLEDCHTIYRKSELAEFSAVSVPGNAEALAIKVSRGFWVPDEVREMLPEVEEDTEEVTRDMDGDGDDSGDDTEECFDAGNLRCTSRHADGHCPRCGEIAMCYQRAEGSCYRCHRGHEFPASEALACPYNEPERAVELPPSKGPTFGEVLRVIDIRIKAEFQRRTKELREQLDLVRGRV